MALRNSSIGILSLAILALACKPEVEQRPANILPPEKMVAIQAGVHRTEAELSIRRMDFPMALPMFQQRLDSILRLNKTDTGTYRRSFNWYAEHVEEMDKVYQAVIDTLSLQESRLMGRKDTAAKK